MALTIVQVETILTKRVGLLMAAVGLDGSTIDGDNGDLVDPVGYSIRKLGGTIADITDIVDADLATFEETQYDELLDIAELRALQSVQGNFALVDTKIGPRDEKWGALGSLIDKTVSNKQTQVENLYSFGVSTLSANIVEYDFSTLD